MAKIYYARVDEFWRKEQKYEFLEARQHRAQVGWQPIQPNGRHTWLTEGLQIDFEIFLPLGTQEAKAGRGKAIFSLFSNGVKTNRDTWACNFNRTELAVNIQRMIGVYNDHVYRWASLGQKPQIDDFVLNDSTKISWSRDLKLDLKRRNVAKFDQTKLRLSLYRPFVKQYLFFDRILNEEVYQFPSVLPLSSTEAENRIICVNRTGEKPFTCLVSNIIPDLVSTGGFGSRVDGGAPSRRTRRRLTPGQNSRCSQVSSPTTRKPRLPVELSGVLALRAATR
jgi:predicted helicase